MRRCAVPLLLAWLSMLWPSAAMGLGVTPCGPRPAPGWPVILGNGIQAAPATFDLDGDGRSEIAVALRDGRVFVLDGRGVPLPGWPRSAANSICTSPALGDLDGDGRPEMVVAAKDGLVHVWRMDGSRASGWPVDLGSPVVTTPVLLGSKSDSIGVVLATADGRVQLLDEHGHLRAGWPRRVAGRALQLRDQACTVARDLDGDGHAEVLHLAGDGTLHAWNLHGDPVAGFPMALNETGVGLATDSAPDAPIVCTTSGHVFVLDAEGNVTTRMSVGHDSVTSPPTVFATPQAPEDLLIAAATQTGHIHLWDAGGMPLPGWPVHLAGFIYGIAAENERFAVYGAPAVWDVDHDGAMEILVGAYDQHLYCFDLGGHPVPTWPVTLDDAIVSRPVFADLDGDGREELLIGQGGETLFAFRLGREPRAIASSAPRASPPPREWPLTYCAVSCILLGLVALVVVRLRPSARAHAAHVRTRSTAWKTAGVVLLALLVVRLSMSVNEIERYRHAMTRLDTSTIIAKSLLDDEAQALSDRVVRLARELDACDWEKPHDPIRLMYELERLADRDRLDYERSGLMISDASSGHVNQAVGATRSYTRAPVPGPEQSLPGVRVVVLEDQPGLLATTTLGTSLHGDLLHCYSKLGVDLAQKLADATGMVVSIKLDGATVAWAGTSRPPSPGGWPHLGVVQPSREVMLQGRHPVSVALAMERYHPLPTGWLDLTILVLLPLLLYSGDLERVETKRRRSTWWWLPAIVGLYGVGWILLLSRVGAQRPLPLAGHGLGFLLHLVALAAIGYVLPSVVRPEVGRRLRFALLVSYLLVGLLPVTVALVIATRSLQEAQRQAARETLAALETRADNLLLGFVGNHLFEGELRRAAGRLASQPLEDGWFDFVGNTQYLFTYDLPSCYVTLSAQDRTDPSRKFTGYSWRAPRTNKLYDPLPEWAGDDPVQALFTDGGTAEVRATRVFRTQRMEADLVAHVPIDAVVVGVLEERLRILPFLPPVRVEPAWIPGHAHGTQSAGIGLPLSTSITLPARDWSTGAPRWLEYRAAAFLPFNEELWRILTALTLFVLLPLSLSVWGAFFAYRRTGRPLEQLVRGLRRVEAGDLDYRLGATGQTEVAIGARSFDRMVDSLKQTIGSLAEKKKIEEISALKSRFISMVSHDLKTPLASIQGAAENVLGELAGPVTAKQRTYLEMILASSSILQQIISDLLDLSRIESGHLVLELDTLDMRPEINRAIISIHTLLEERSLSVQVEQTVDRALVRADGMRLWQILNNVLSNAVRYSPRGGVLRIRIENDRLPSNGQRSIRTVVSDQGPGIATEAIEHVFEPFFHRPRQDGRRGGAGLGLAIVKQLVELHGGRVAIERSDAGGTSIAFSLLAAPSRADMSAGSAQLGANLAQQAQAGSSSSSANLVAP